MSLENPRIVLIGAGSAQFGYGTLGDIFQSEIFRKRDAHIVLHDINPKTMATVAKTGQEFIESHQLPFTISATTDRKEALAGADFCIISIEIGNRFELWEQDWQVPLQYGMRQVYGENGGPGGFFHSLRIIPPILEICGDIAEICPNAFIFNFSNPMSRICTTVHLNYPGLKFIGLCHEIASLERHLPKILDIPFEKLQVQAGGLNHFSVMLEVRHQETGEDLYPEVMEKAPAYFKDLAQPLLSPQEQQGEESVPLRKGAWHERGLFRTIMEKFNLLPITTDSHFGEYIPWAYETVDHKGILDFYNAYKVYVMNSQPRIALKLTERVVPIMEGILEDESYIEAAVNIPNQGFIADLPNFIAVEVPATISKNGIQGIPIGDMLPPGFTGLLQNQVAIHRLTAETVLSGSRDVALQALLVDPIVDKVAAADKMLSHMLEIQNKYLGYIR